jgi:hypothetical protein
MPSDLLISIFYWIQPKSTLSLYLGSVCIILKTIKFAYPQEKDPVTAFMYTLKTPDTKRNYPQIQIFPRFPRDSCKRKSRLNLLIVDLKPFFDSALVGDLAPFRVCPLFMWHIMVADAVY